MTAWPGWKAVDGKKTPLLSYNHVLIPSFVRPAHGSPSLLAGHFTAGLAVSGAALLSCCFSHGGDQRRPGDPKRPR
jgi:hypothetical protein